MQSEKLPNFDMLSHVMIIFFPAKKYTGIFVGNFSLLGGLGLQASGLGGEHSEGRLFSWSIDRGAGGARKNAHGLGADAPPNAPQEKTTGFWMDLWFYPRNWGNQFTWNMGEYWGIFHGKNSGAFYVLTGIILPIIHHHPLKFPWKTTPRSWRNPLVMECQSAAMHVVDFMHWSITLAVPISMSTGNMRDESGTNIRWFLLGFWDGIPFWEGKMGEKLGVQKWKICTKH